MGLRDPAQELGLTELINQNNGKTLVHILFAPLKITDIHPT
jgi:hypothetical protein